MKHYRSDFQDEPQHPTLTKIIWWIVGIAIAVGAGYIGGLEYVIADMMK